jgi:hypothetical protein
VVIVFVGTSLGLSEESAPSDMRSQTSVKLHPTVSKVKSALKSAAVIIALQAILSSVQIPVDRLQRVVDSVEDQPMNLLSISGLSDVWLYGRSYSVPV